jgi:hypothetical protein
LCGHNILAEAVFITIPSGNVGVSVCAGYDKLLFHECYTSVSFAVSLPPPKELKFKFSDIKISDICDVYFNLFLTESMTRFFLVQIRFRFSDLLNSSDLIITFLRQCLV